MVTADDLDRDKDEDGLEDVLAQVQETLSSPPQKDQPEDVRDSAGRLTTRTPGGVLRAVDSAGFEQIPARFRHIQTRLDIRLATPLHHVVQVLRKGGTLFGGWMSADTAVRALLIQAWQLPSPKKTSEKWNRKSLAHKGLRAYFHRLERTPLTPAPAMSTS